MHIDMNLGIGYTSILYPDNQPHVRLISSFRYERYVVTCSITDSIKLLQLQMVADAIDVMHGQKMNLYIPYLMGARFDRVMQPGDSFDLRVIAKIINSLGFKEVHLIDPHNPDVTYALINNAVIHTNQHLVESYNEQDAVLIVPDLGAMKKSITYPSWNPRIKDIVQCEKHRDLSTGTISLSMNNANTCRDRNCVIIDDLCDGGGTFLAIANHLKNMRFVPKTLTLIVTHGIFSNKIIDGKESNSLRNLEKYFNKIIVSDSYRQSYGSDIVQIQKAFL